MAKKTKTQTIIEPVPHVEASVEAPPAVYSDRIRHLRGLGGADVNLKVGTNVLTAEQRSTVDAPNYRWLFEKGCLRWL